MKEHKHKRRKHGSRERCARSSSSECEKNEVYGSYEKKETKRKTKKHKDKDRESKSSRKHGRKKEKKNSSKRKRRRSYENSSDESDNSDEEEVSAPDPQYEHAMSVVLELLSEFPSIGSDLLNLLQMLDDGEIALVGGIANDRVRSFLMKLFPLLGLATCRGMDDAFTSRGRRDRVSLMETVAHMLKNCTEISSTLSRSPSKTDVHEAKIIPRYVEPIGPQRPPTEPAESLSHPQDDGSDEDNVIGPVLPGMKGFRVADEGIDADMERRALEMKTEAWRRARHGEAPASTESTRLTREDWMTQMPSNNTIFRDAMGGASQRPTNQPAAFRAKEPATIDRTWFDSPEERERAKRAKLDMELLGYVRDENAPTRPPSTDPLVRNRSTPGVNESILPAANREADDDMRKQMEALKQNRGASLLEQHQKKIATERAKGGKNHKTNGPIWDRDRDLVVRRSMTQDDADRILNQSKQISTKFTAPTITRQFL